MDRQTLAHYGWIVIVALVLAVMLALATPFGKYVMDGVSSIASGYINASNEAMSEENKDKLVSEWEDKWLNSTGNEHVNPTPVIDVMNPNGIVPEGAQYKDVSTGITYNPGENMNITPEEGDWYKYNGYTYYYGRYWCPWGYSIWCDCSDTTCEGWSVHYFGSEASPPPIIESINGENVTTMVCAFQDSCFDSDHTTVTAPQIPKTIIYAGNAFDMCEELTGAVLFPCTAHTNGAVSSDNAWIETYHYEGRGH